MKNSYITINSKHKDKVNKQKEKGFTLIELIIVLGIIGILMSAIVPKMTGQTTAAKKKADKITARTIGLAYETEIASGKQYSNIVEQDILNTYFNGTKPQPQSSTGEFVVTGEGNNIVVKVSDDVLYP